MKIRIDTMQCPCRTLNNECGISNNECYEDDICSTCPLIRNGGIKELEQEPMLDKIKAEIGALPKTYPFVNHIDMYVKEDDVKKIIDKYKAESEGKENNEDKEDNENNEETYTWKRELIRNEKGGCIDAKMICPKCNKDNRHDEYMAYCPNCGAKMAESEGKE